MTKYKSAGLAENIVIEKSKILYYYIIFNENANSPINSICIILYYNLQYPMTTIIIRNTLEFHNILSLITQY